ncbi:Transposase, Ptta/En/Spm, plant [Corchorus capsularis]|uniref:Transposase, Ptta/En/Spm, plant n=1 Tax=Corchorus capsularis TaxID=210143 RepID=A0A1R3FYV8_COCAP|nr:Transposase, Ptta/En/Spm, plant [Corchorus capsularis]
MVRGFRFNTKLHDRLLKTQNNRGCKKDKFGFTFVNFGHPVHTGDSLVNEPFILAEQAKKVFYIKGERDNGWCVVKHAKLRNAFDMGDESTFRSNQRNLEILDTEVDDSNNSSIWVRTKVNEGIDVTPVMRIALVTILAYFVIGFARILLGRPVHMPFRMAKRKRMNTVRRNRTTASESEQPSRQQSEEQSGLQFEQPSGQQSGQQSVPTRPKKVRGHTRMSGIRDLDKEENIVVKIESGEFVNEETSGVIKAWALEDMSTKWRQWKNELKSKYYDEDKTPEQMLEAVNDPRVDKNQFLVIATYWLSTKAKDQSAIDRENCSKSVKPHCVGTKSFSRIIQTMTEEAHGILPSRIDVYVRTRTRKDGNYVNEKAAQVVEHIKEIRLQNDDHSEEVSWTNDVFLKWLDQRKEGVFVVRD